jgi:hypothetical protein
VEVGRDCYGFHSGITRTQSGYDYIWVIVYHLNEVAHFIPIKMTYTGPQLVNDELYQDVLIRCQSYRGDYACSFGGAIVPGGDRTGSSTQVPIVRCA